MLRSLFTLCNVRQRKRDRLVRRHGVAFGMGGGKGDFIQLGAYRAQNAFVMAMFARPALKIVSGCE